MFADYGYGDYGRSWRKKFKKIVKAPARIIKAPIRAVTKITKAVVKAPMALVGKAMQRGSQVEQLVEGPMEQPTIESTIAPQIDAYTQPSIQTAVPVMRPVQPTLAQIHALIRQSMMQQQAPIPQTYVPQQQVYAQPSAEQVQQYNIEQRQPERSYYSEDNYPTQEGSAINEDFRQAEMEDEEYPMEDFQGYGLDEDTADLLSTELNASQQAAIEAGEKYVSKIQGKPNTTGGNIATEKSGASIVPSWVWAALGITAALAVMAKPKTKRAKR